MSKTVAFVFPGQGSQKIGMGREWAEAFPEARRTFEEADDVLHDHLSKLCWEGPEETLQLTVNTQPALLVTSVAILRAIDGAGLDPVAMAGHSLGEYSALVAAGALSFADALYLVRQRGRFMQEAVPVGEGAMAAIIGLSIAEVGEIAGRSAQGQVCALANLNGEQQTVIAGHLGAVERAVAAAKEQGAKKAVLLSVSAPFHSPLMQGAREALTPLLEGTTFRDPRVPVLSNVDAQPVRTGAAARDALIRQVDAPVRWVECVQWMAEQAGVGTFLEVGFGKVLTGLNRRIAREASCISLETPAALDTFLAAV